jgi:hypothetical protein
VRLNVVSTASSKAVKLSPANHHLSLLLQEYHGKTSSRSHQKASTKATATHNRAASEFAFAEVRKHSPFFLK